MDVGEDSSTPSTVPTPLARVASRLTQAQTSGSVNEVFDASLFLAEASLKWAVVTGISVLREYSPARADFIARRLVRGESAGAWVTALRETLRRLARTPSPTGRDWARTFTEKRSPDDPEPKNPGGAATELGHVIDALGEFDYTGVSRRRHSLVDVFGDVVFVRNRTRGHGAQTTDFYQQTASRMAGAAREILSSLPDEYGWWVVTNATGDASVARALVGDTVSDLLTIEFDERREVGSLLAISETDVCRIESLAYLRLETMAVSFANGRWNDSRAICQFIDYSTGQTAFLNLPDYAGAAEALPASETSALPELVWGASSAHNLPDAAQGYVNRRDLESILSRLLGDRQHRIITLRGPGGMGKTALALHVVTGLVDAPDDMGFDLVAWLSARDIDLLPGGPADRRRDVADLDELAEAFSKLTLDAPLQGEEALDHLAAQVGDGSGDAVRYLLVVDNLETFDSPERVQQFLDEVVVLPSKVLFTSRHETFRGDYPVSVGGMELEEATRLLVTEARRQYIEPRMTQPVIRQLIEITGASPYAMKLAVAQIASGQHPDEVVRTLDKRLDILAALFDRSFEVLTAAGRFLYLFLGAVGAPALELAAMSVFTSIGHSFEDAADELERSSLATRNQEAAHDRRIELPELAKRHADKKLIGHDDELLIRHTAKRFREWSAPRPRLSPAESFFASVFDHARGLPDSAERLELLTLAERAAEGYPQLWERVASEWASAEIDADRTRAAFKRAAEEAQPDDPTVWTQWAAFEKREGDELQYLNKCIRAVEADPSDVGSCSRVASELADYVTANKEAIPAERRGFLLSSVRTALEEHHQRGQLDATDLSRLGWLYLLEFSARANPDYILIQRAHDRAADGLKLDGRNVYCQRLWDRTLEELEAAGVE